MLTTREVMVVSLFTTAMAIAAFLKLWSTISIGWNSSPGIPYLLHSHLKKDLQLVYTHCDRERL